MTDKRDDRRGKKVMSNKDALTGAVAGDMPKHRRGRARRKERSWRNDLADLEKTYGAEGARARLGVSKSTWRAWHRRGGKRQPSKANRARITDEWNTPTVRRKVVAPRNAAKAVTNGGKVTLGGKIGPRADISDEEDSPPPRIRDIKFNLSGDQMRDLFDTFVSDGPEAAHDRLAHYAATEYFNKNNAYQDMDEAEIYEQAEAFIEELHDFALEIFDEVPEGSEYDEYPY